MACYFTWIFLPHGCFPFFGVAILSVHCIANQLVHHCMPGVATMPAPTPHWFSGQDPSVTAMVMPGRRRQCFQIECLNEGGPHAVRFHANL